MAIDYKSFSDGKEANPETNQGNNWWAQKGNDLADAVHKIVYVLQRFDSSRITQYQISSKLYNNVSLMGLNGYNLSKISTNASGQKDRITYNVVASAIDTVIAKMSKNKPKPLFLTSGADYKMQRRAKKLDKFVEGIFYENKAYELSIETLLDAAVFGDGFVQVYCKDGKICYDRVMPGELYTDWLESYYGKPRQLHRPRNYDRDILVQMFPKYKKQILEAKSATSDMVGVQQNVADQVTVVESWRLPSSIGGTDGIHCITIPGQVLYVEQWNKDHFPFAHFRWAKRLNGFWGQGAAEQIQNIQLEINKILWIIQRSIHLAGSFKILNKIGNKVVTEHLNNDIGAIIEYTDTPPQYVVPPIVPMELYNQVENLKRSAFEKIGVSMLSATSQKPAGLNSAVALREYNDIETERFMVLGKLYEGFFLQLAELTIDCAKELDEAGETVQISVPEKSSLKAISWKEVDLDKDAFVMKMYPVSSLPSDPAGRLQTITEYMQAGMLSPRAGRRLLDFPDLEQVEVLANSREDYLHNIFDKIIEDGVYTPPEPYDDLELARELSLEYYAQGKNNGLEEDKLEMIRQFLDQVDLLIQKATTPPPGAMPPEGMQQGAVLGEGMQAPTSELMPMR